MEKYLDFRFRNFVVISQKEIADYYRDIYVPRFRSQNPGRIVPTLEAFSPMPTVGLPDARSGGQFVAHAPKQVLFRVGSELNW